MRDLSHRQRRSLGGKASSHILNFLGLRILRKSESEPVKKCLVEKMFDWMLPCGAGALKLSRINMLGMGTKMMQAVINDKNISSLAD